MIQKNILLPLGFSLLFALTALNTNAQEPKLPGILKRSPSRANTVVYVNAPSLSNLMSQAGMGGGLSDNVGEIWSIADLDLDRVSPKWEVGYATLNSEVDTAALAAAMKGYVDKVSGKEVVRTKKQSFLVPLESNRLGFMRPADRSLLASWMDESVETARISDFLKKQAVRSESFLSFLMAVDLSNRFSPVGLETRLSGLASMQGQDVKKIAAAMASIQGVSIIVGRRSLGECILEIEHGESPEALMPVASKLLTEILNRNGTSVPEVANWKATLKGNSIQFQGAISEDTLDSVLGILSLQGHANQVAESASQVQKNDSQVAYVTKQYFDRVNQYIERVRKYKAQTTGFRAKWNDQQARRIEELGTLNVDPEMVEYGAAVAQMLRGNAVSIQQGNVAAGQKQAANMGYGGGYYGGYYGGYGEGYYGYGGNAYTNARQQASIGAQQRMAGFGSFKQALSAIDKLTAETRRKFTAKYEIQF